MTSGMLVVLGALGLLLERQITIYFSVRQPIVMLASVVLVLSGVSAIMYAYLMGVLQFGKRPVEPLLSGGVREAGVSLAGLSDVSYRLAGLEASFAELRDAQLSAVTGDRAKLIEALRPGLIQDVSRQVADELANVVDKATHLLTVRAVFAASERRLRSEIDSLNRRGAINLVIGAVATIVAGGFLFVLLPDKDKTFDGTAELLAYYLPRLAVVVFVEVFAFFFLRLYKATLQEVRACQLDLTDLGLRHAAVETVWGSEEPGAKVNLASSLFDKPSAATVERDSGIDPKLLSDLLSVVGKIASKKE